MTSEDSLFAYGDDGGFVNIPASRDRAKEEASSGVFSARALLILETLGKTSHGFTWKELAEKLNLHHGQVSGALSNLHRKGLVFMLQEKRNRSHPYVHSDFREMFTASQRIDDPTRTQASLRREIESDIARQLYEALVLQHKRRGIDVQDASIVLGAMERYEREMLDD
jgi:predicted transcriptional regulator